MDLSNVRSAAGARLARALKEFLDQPLSNYELKSPNDMPRLYRQIRKGDVVLVDGQLRVSALVKYATQSPWSHCALYVGDELVRRGGRLRDEALRRFGDLADRLIVEALIEEGVVVAPLAKYEQHDIRVCRPSAIAQSDVDRVVDTVLGDLGKPYDTLNFVDLAVLLLSPFKVGRARGRTSATCLGRCTDLAVICSGMLARAFHEVGYPILPQAGSPMTLRHHSQILPRDFDLSPNFEIVKFNTVADAVVPPMPVTAAARRQPCGLLCPAPHGQAGLTGTLRAA